MLDYPVCDTVCIFMKSTRITQMTNVSPCLPLRTKLRAGFENLTPSLVMVRSEMAVDSGQNLCDSVNARLKFLRTSVAVQRKPQAGKGD